MSNSVFNLDHMTQMVRMQMESQNGLLGKSWIDKRQSDDVNFCNAILAETGELADHLAYKWWKKQDVDIRQAKMEVVDILHFLICEIVQKFATDSIAPVGLTFSSSEMKREYDSIVEAAIGRTLGAFSLGFSVARLLESDGAIDQYNSENIGYRKNKLIALMSTLPVVLNPFSFNSVTARMNLDRDIMTVSESCQMAAETFFVCCSMMGISFKELYLLYMAKNVLNKFRWDNGYKEGTYVKTWNGLEDNEVLHAYIDKLLKLDNLSAGTDYTVLIERYLTEQYASLNTADAKSA